MHKENLSSDYLLKLNWLHFVKQLSEIPDFKCLNLFLSRGDIPPHWLPLVFYGVKGFILTASHSLLHCHRGGDALHCRFHLSYLWSKWGIRFLWTREGGLWSGPSLVTADIIGATSEKGYPLIKKKSWLIYARSLVMETVYRKLNSGNVREK